VFVEGGTCACFEIYCASRGGPCDSVALVFEFSVIKRYNKNVSVNHTYNEQDSTPWGRTYIVVRGGGKISWVCGHVVMAVGVPKVSMPIKCILLACRLAV